MFKVILHTVLATSLLEVALLLQGCSGPAPDNSPSGSQTCDNGWEVSADCRGRTLVRTTSIAMEENLCNSAYRERPADPYVTVSVRCGGGKYKIEEIQRVKWYEECNQESVDAAIQPSCSSEPIRASHQCKNGWEFVATCSNDLQTLFSNLSLPMDRDECEEKKGQMQEGVLAPGITVSFHCIDGKFVQALTYKMTNTTGTLCSTVIARTWINKQIEESCPSASRQCEDGWEIIANCSNDLQTLFENRSLPMDREECEEEKGEMQVPVFLTEDGNTISVHCIDGKMIQELTFEMTTVFGECSMDMVTQHVEEFCSIPPSASRQCDDWQIVATCSNDLQTLTENRTLPMDSREQCEETKKEIHPEDGVTVHCIDGNFTVKVTRNLNGLCNIDWARGFAENFCKELGGTDTVAFSATQVKTETLDDHVNKAPGIVSSFKKIKENVNRLKLYKSKLLVFPKKSGKKGVKQARTNKKYLGEKLKKAAAGKQES